MTVFDEELKLLYEKCERKKKVASMMAELRERRKALSASEAAFRQIMEDEQSDVDRLEAPGLAAYFYSILGKREEKLDRERAEAYAAKAKHSAALSSLEAASRDLDALEAEFAGLEGVEGRFRQLLDKKTDTLKRGDPINAAEISRIEERLIAIANQLRETSEALAAGEAALRQADAAASCLGSAEGWGTFDLLGGGLISDIAKHSRLDEAQSQVEELQILLGRYRSELLDVSVSAGMNVQIEGFLKFADFFFDGIFADWAVLDRIHSSQQQLSSVQSQICGIQNRLLSSKASLEQECLELKARLDKLVVEA